MMAAMRAPTNREQQDNPAEVVRVSHRQGTKRARTAATASTPTGSRKPDAEFTEFVQREMEAGAALARRFDDLPIQLLSEVYARESVEAAVSSLVRKTDFDKSESAEKLDPHTIKGMDGFDRRIYIARYLLSNYKDVDKVLASLAAQMPPDLVEQRRAELNALKAKRLAEQAEAKVLKASNSVTVDESKSPDYNVATPSPEAAASQPLLMGETEAIDTLAHLHGEGVRKVIRDYVAAKNETAAPAAPAATAPTLAWPSEKWETSPEKMGRKLHAIEAYMRRVWKPFVEETGAVVTFAMLKKIDKKGGEAWASYVGTHGAVADIPIVSTKKLARNVADRPAVFTDRLRVGRIAAI
ncbi:MAG TPA: hypothetical protein VK759_09320 [Rhizomicrobium sp.]|jgi:hypothetical protein|nr:hypothetical protein [Rhizomicrobium sp.]